MSTITPEQAAEHLKDYLSGMHRVDPIALAQICDIDDWSQRAFEEMRRRLTARTLGVIDDQTLWSIAKGDVKLQEVAAELLATTP